MSPDFTEREVYCCRPEPFMQAVRDMPNAHGFDMAHYHQESYGSLSTIVDTDVMAGDTVPGDDVTSRVKFTNSAVSTTCVQGSTLLAVAKAAGLNIPSGCRWGFVVQGFEIQYSVFRASTAGISRSRRSM